MPTQMITCFILITLWLGSSVFYAEAACKYCKKLQNYRGPFTSSTPDFPWIISEDKLSNKIRHIVSDASQIPKFKELQTRPIHFSIKTDLCGDNITFNMVLEDTVMHLDTYPKGYRITSWQEPT